MSRISFEAFLRDVVRVDPAVLKFYHARTMGEWGVGTDAVSALDCWGFGLPGFQGMKLAKGSIPRMGFTPAGYEDTGGSLRLHFPDGNATIARLLVQNLTSKIVPAAPNCSRPRSRPSSATSATSWPARSQNGGFDPARDITAITVNRWPHGYAPEYNPLFDPELPEAEQPHVGGPRAIRPDYDREFRFRWRGIYRFGDRSRASRSHGAAEELRRSLIRQRMKIMQIRLK